MSICFDRKRSKTYILGFFACLAVKCVGARKHTYEDRECVSSESAEHCVSAPVLIGSSASLASSPRGRCMCGFVPHVTAQHIAWVSALSPSLSFFSRDRKESHTVKREQVTITTHNDVDRTWRDK